MLYLPQVFYIHGGMTFASREDYRAFLQTAELRFGKEDRIKWSDTLSADLAGHYEVIAPRMPIKEDAHYEEWKIYFEKLFPFLRDNITLIGNSLGGIFLAKYLSENILPVSIAAVHLVCPPFDNTLSTEPLLGGFTLGDTLPQLTKQAPRTTLYFSEDDPIVPIAHAEKYKAKLPDANVHIYASKNGHFQIETFPELLQALKTAVPIKK